MSVMKSKSRTGNPDLELVLFDFGGVLAEEGFREGLISIALLNGLLPTEFYKNAVKLIHENGYLTGNSDEKDFWNNLRSRYLIKGSDEELRNELLKRFVIRQWMIDVAEKLKKMNMRTAILSDQTNWLDELDLQHGFSKYFDRVFNSYHLKKSKDDPSIFDDVLSFMNAKAGRALFIDDNNGNIERAKQKGLNTIHFTDREAFEKEFAFYFPRLK
jgi:putative hydrolase of the HAD superfamily